MAVPKYNSFINDNSVFYTDMAYQAEEAKKKAVWMAQMLFYCKRNSVAFADAKELREYRDADRLIVDEAPYRNLVDPASPMTQAGQRAENFSADFKPFPIDMHLNNIVRGIIEKLPNLLTTKVIDPIAKRMEQKEKDKIAYAPLYRKLINQFATELGLPKIGENQDPYKYIENLDAKEFDKLADTIGDPVEQLKNRIRSDDEMRIYFQYLYRNGIEMAFDAAIKHYMLNMNKFDIKQEYYVNDLMHINSYSGRYYIDKLTGRPTIAYIDPASLRTSPFMERNGDDIIYWFYEQKITIAEFERMLGAGLTNEQKKRILEANKLWTNTNLVLPAVGDQADLIWQYQSRTNAEVVIGFFSVLTQEDSEYAAWLDTPEGQEPTLTKQVNPQEDATQKTDRKVYNVWYNCYYLPLPSDLLDQRYGGRNVLSTEDWVWLTNYIFCIEKEVDMYRFGADLRYSRSSLVCWKDLSRPSFNKIKKQFMPKIHHLWHKLQNCIVNDTTGVVFDEDLFSAMLNSIDGANENDAKGGNEIVNQLRYLRQSGMSTMKFRSKNGDIVLTDPSKLIVNVDSKHLDKAERYLLMILSLYNQMTQALALTDVMQAKQPDPRTPVSGLELAYQSANNARWYIEKPARQLAIGYAERTVRHVWNMARERKMYKYEKRWNEFRDVVGSALAGAIEVISDVNPENIGITIKNDYDDQKREVIYQMAMQKNAEGRIGTNELGLILDMDNWRMAIMAMVLAESKKQEEAEMMAEAQHQRQMEQMQMQLQIAQAQQQVKTQGRVAEIGAQAQADAEIQAQQIQGKTQSQMAQKEQLAALKMEQDANKSQLKRAEMMEKKYLEEQQA